jgi:hypothetical protein
MTDTTQSQRIRWRQRVLAVGGALYLSEKSALFEYSEKRTCPTFIRLPRGLAFLVWLHEREYPAEI